MSLLEVDGLRVRLRTGSGLVTVVDGVDYHVDRGEVFGVAGESGSGKTISMLALFGLLPEGAAVEGRVRFDDRDLLGLSRSRLREVSGRDLAMVFQDPLTSLHPMLSIGRQLTEHVQQHLGLDRRAAGRRALELLEEVRIPDGEEALRAFPHQFSGGMRQRIAIAIALACRPKLLIADEPTTALDVTVQAGILRLLDRLRQENDLAVVLITHDLGVMSAIADRLAIFYAGRVVEAGSRTDVLRAPAPPLHPGAPRRAAPPGGDPLSAARRDPRRAADPGGDPGRLRLQPALLVRPRQLPDGRAAARPGRRPAARLSGRPVRRRMSTLELRDIVVDYERRGGARVRAVAGASLTVEPGRIVGLVGESGCGKSTLARAAVGLVKTTSGTVLFGGREVGALGRHGRDRELARLQLVFQNPYASLNPRRRIGSQLSDALTTLGLTPPAARAGRVRELCETVGLPAGAVDRFPHEFSGGQRQRIAIARTLAAEPSVIVLDEPLASLDASAQAQLANLLVNLSRELGLGLLLISHDLAIVRHVADAVSVMYLGRMVETGPTRELWDLPLHPYTESLIRAIPHPDGSGFLPDALPGEVPDPGQPPSGCRFHPRCPYAFARCGVEDPPLVPLAGDREAACWLQPAGAPPAPPAERLQLVGPADVN